MDINKKQIQKLREIFKDIEAESELLELAALRDNVHKGINILNKVEVEDE